MNINDLIKELKKDDKVYKLSILYLRVKGKEKEFLLELYDKSSDTDVIKSIENAIYEDEDAMCIIRKIVNAQTIANGDIPSFKQTSESIKKQMSSIDKEDLKNFIEENRKR